MVDIVVAVYLLAILAAAFPVAVGEARPSESYHHDHLHPHRHMIDYRPSTTPPHPPPAVVAAAEITEPRGRLSRGRMLGVSSGARARTVEPRE